MMGGFAPPPQQPVLVPTAYMPSLRPSYVPSVAPAAPAAMPMPVRPTPMPQYLVPPGVSGNRNSATPDSNPPLPIQGQVHMLITGIDYACDKQSWAGPPPHGNGPLDTKFAFEMMKELAYKSGASYTTLWNEQCTKEGIVRAILEVGAKCQPEDTFVFYYTGHGDQLPNDQAAYRLEGEESDQCFCLVDARGNTDDPTMQYRRQVWMRDDDFAKAVLHAVGPMAKVLVLIDACHSGTICDFTPQSEWAKRRQRAISISGCQDSETSAGTGKGGMFTRALTKAVQDLQGRGSYNVSALYNRTLEHYVASKLPGHTQSIAIHGCVTRPMEMAWPLQPRSQYVSPANTRWRGIGAMPGA